MANGRGGLPQDLIRPLYFRGPVKPNDLIPHIIVESFANEGRCIGRHNGKVIFIKGAVPGEQVTVRITRIRKDWMEAETEAVETPSPDRRQPFCCHFGYCGGCQWQHVTYEKQLRYKAGLVTETLSRLGNIIPRTVFPITGSDQERAYRNKLEFTFSHREWQTMADFQQNPEKQELPALGYHLSGAFDRVFDLKECHLQPPVSDRIRLAVKKFTAEKGYAYFNLRQQQGLMRNMIIRLTVSGEVMVLMVFSADDRSRIQPLMDFLKEEFPEITSLLYCINRKKNDTIYDQEVITWAGRDFITEELGNLKFRISAKSFFQTNTRQALKLYEGIKEMAGLSGTELVYDLYTGTGSIALYLAGLASGVVGIESLGQAIEDARRNAAGNGIHNIRFFAGDMAKTLTPSFIAQHGKPGVVVTDPPRAGMMEPVLQSLLDMEPRRIIYVSCNVATQARDLQRLSSKYTVEAIRPYDLFPQTQHIENVAQLELVNTR